jgi:hypothetical protein
MISYASGSPECSGFKNNGKFPMLSVVPKASNNCELYFRLGTVQTKW